MAEQETLLKITPEEKEKWTKALNELINNAGFAGDDNRELTRRETCCLASKNELWVLACLTNPAEGTIGPLIEYTIGEVEKSGSSWSSGDLERIANTINEAFGTFASIFGVVTLHSRSEPYRLTVEMAPRIREFIFSTIPLEKKKNILEAGIKSANILITYISKPQEGVTAKIPYPEDTLPLYESSLSFLGTELARLTPPPNPTV